MSLLIFHHARWRAVLFFGLILVSVLCSQAQQPTLAAPQPGGFTPITADNIHQLELGYALPGPCVEFSPDGTLVSIRQDIEDSEYRYQIYDLATGTHLTAIPGSFKDYYQPYLLNPDGTFKGLDNGPNSEEILDWLGSNFADTSPDGTLIARDDNGVYDILSGEKLFSISGYAEFHPDGRWLISSGTTTAGDGIYDLETGEKVLHLNGIINLSPDRTLVAADRSGVFDLETMENIISFETNNYRFSPGGKYIVTALSTSYGVSGEVYDLATGESLFPISGFPRFNQDETLLIVNQIGVFDLPSGEKRFDISANAVFSPDGKTVVVAMDGVYDLETNQRVIDFQGIRPLPQLYEHYYLYSPDGTYLLVRSQDTYIVVYDVVQRAEIMRIQGVRGALFSITLFSNDGTLLAVETDGVYDLTTAEMLFPLDGYTLTLALDDTLLIEDISDYSTERGIFSVNIHDLRTLETVFELPESTIRYETALSPNAELLTVNLKTLCVLYGIEGSPWPYRAGFVETVPYFVDIRAEPSATSEVIDVVDGGIYVIARLADNSYYQVAGGWIRADLVEPIIIPADLPVIDGSQ